MMRPIWVPVKGCPKCDGVGWVWGHELDEYHGEGSPMVDDTKYTCDHECHNDDENAYLIPNGDRA